MASLFWHAWKLFLLGAFLELSVDCCTVILAGRQSTENGSPLVAGTDDSGPSPNDIRLVKVPAAYHKSVSLRPVYPSHAVKGGYPRLVSEHRGPEYMPRDGDILTAPLGYIPEVPYTHGYFENKYGLMNDVGLAFGESTCGAKTVGWAIGTPGGTNMFGIMELVRVALERCSTARCAIRTMGQLAVEHGYYGDGTGTPENPGYDGASESVGIIDAEGEAWLFHVMTGPQNHSAVWAAQRVLDHQVAVIPNGFVIRQMNLSDSEHFMASPNVLSFAQDMGWWRPSDGPFDFTAAYSHFGPGPNRALSVGRRLWRILDLLAPSLNLDMRLGYAKYPTYPVAVTPDKPVTMKVIRRILRDHYEGTPLDLTKGVAAGPFGNPVRFGGSRVPGGFERAISMYRALYSHIAQSRCHMPSLVAGVLWFGFDAPHGTVYIPFYGGQQVIPKAFSTGMQSVFSTESAYWAFSFVNNWIQLKYSFMIPEVHEEQNRFEQLGEKKVTRWDAKIVSLLKDGSKAEAQEYIEQQTCRFAEEVLDHRWNLASKLVAKYSNGNIVTGEGPQDLTVPGYPLDWLNQTSYVQYPGDAWLSEEEFKRRQVSRSSNWGQDVIILGVLALVVCAALFVWRRSSGASYQAV